MEPIIGNNYYVWGMDGNKWVGRLEAVGPHCFHLKEASWVASDGRLHLFVKEGRADNMEIEPVGEVTVNWSSYIPWPHKLFGESV